MYHSNLSCPAVWFSSFWVNNELFFGVDHLHFVERALGNKSAVLPRFYPAPAEPRKAKMTIYHDFSSPWSYIGSTQVTVITLSVVVFIKPITINKRGMVPLNNRNSGA